MVGIFSKQFWAETARAEFISKVISAAFPIVGTAVTTWIGYLELQFVPPIYIAVCIFATFAFLSAGVLYLKTLLYQTAPEAKLRFGGVSFSISTDFDKNKKGVPTGKAYVSGIRVSLSLNNAANFPMFVHIDKISTRLDGKFPIDKDGKPIPAKTIDMKIDSMGSGFVNDVIVPVDRVKAVKGFELLEGDFEYSLKYGKTKDNCYYSLTGKFVIRAYLNNPPQLPIFEWHNQ